MIQITPTSWHMECIRQHFHFFGHLDAVRNQAPQVSDAGSHSTQDMFDFLEQRIQEAGCPGWKKAAHDTEQEGQP
ncbi:hypothetical protein PMIN03_010959 [Paraphaeosphaeria minitans]